MQVFTPHFLRGLRSNPRFNICTDPSHIDLDHSDNLGKYDHHLFQIVIFENLEGPGKLVYGTKQDLETKYFPEKKGDPHYPLFPTLGAIVKEKFLPSNILLKAAERPTIRFLLQCRQLSQVMTHTWDNNPPHYIKLVKQIFDSYNEIPQTHWLEGETSELIHDSIELNNKLLGIKKTNEDFLQKDYFLIKPEYTSYSSISLALLLCGQAYYYEGTFGNSKLVRICEPIFSTYEMVWEYALDLSWDTFYASRIDISAATGKPQPPYTRVTLGYPPRPHEFASPDGQRKLKEWATATEYDEEIGFYPKQGSPQWRNQQINRIEPPYPYLPLSCS